MQGGQPVAYASRALNPAETCYAQIEKELLAIVFGCDHFEAYVYGRDVVHVETDHKPLEMIMLKLLNSAPKRLQRMLVHLQKYNLEVKYKRGDTLFLADTLSRAHRAKMHVLQQELIFKGQRLVVPVSMRKNMMIAVHSTHIGIEGCLRRARDSIYWACMTTELKDYISKCDICLAYRQTPSKEPLQQHEFTERSWSKVGIDLCDFHGRTLLVLVDYHSNFIEVEWITSLTTSG